MTECRDEKQEGGVSHRELRAYCTPQLTCYGLIQAVTQGSNQGSVPDGGIAMFMIA